MAKEMSVTCNFIQHNLHCVLPENTMDILLKVTPDWENIHSEKMFTLGH